MLDIKRVRNDFDEVKRRILLRGKGDFGLDKLTKLDKERRELLVEVETMKNQQKTVSKKIPLFKKEGKDTNGIMIEMKTLSATIKALDDKVKVIDEALKDEIRITVIATGFDESIRPEVSSVIKKTEKPVEESVEKNEPAKVEAENKQVTNEERAALLNTKAEDPVDFEIPTFLRRKR